MELTPDRIFRRMERVYERRLVSDISGAGRSAPVVLTPAPHSGTYKKLMRSHDRMGMRQLQ